MSDEFTGDHEQREPGLWAASDLLSTPVCAVVAFTLAVAALLGQNVVTVGVSSVLASAFGPSNASFYVGWGLATAAQVGVVLLLARRTLGATSRWEVVLGRAAVLVAGVALVAALLVTIGGAFTDGQSGF